MKLAHTPVPPLSVKVVLCDYRLMPKEWVFDGIVSVGMFEAVVRG
jgi:cyclopropane fatty-acyl-phospholipid synthase-like methyltransferase